MPNITMPGVTLKEEPYRGFIISWQEPPMMGGRWTANVATNDPKLLHLLKGGAAVIDGKDRDDMIAASKKYIDGLSV